MEWKTFTLARLEAARVWNDLVIRHRRIRILKWKWPLKSRWQKWAKKRYPNLHSQSVQQVINEFCEAISSAKQLKKNGKPESRYPWKKPKYRDVPYTNQAVRINDNFLILPNCKSGNLKIKIPKKFNIPGRIIKVRLTYDNILITYEVNELTKLPQKIIGIDLGVNTMISATDGETAVLISGRELKAIVQWRNKQLASLQHKQSKKMKGSRRWKSLQKRKYKLLEKSRRKIHDITHKATRKIADIFPESKAIIGEPFNDAAQKINKKQAQQVSQACNRKIIQQLKYKMSGATTIPEHFTSQTCPVCGKRRKTRRIYKCSCGLRAPRDVIGSVNILKIGLHGKMEPDPNMPKNIYFIHPIKKYPGSRIQVVPVGPRKVDRGIQFLGSPDKSCS